MSLNPDPSKQAQEVVLFRKTNKPSNPDLIFNNKQIIQTPYQKHLSMFLDDKLNFGEHFKYIANKVNTLRCLINGGRGGRLLIFRF